MEHIIAQLSHLVIDKELEQFQIIKVTNYNCLSQKKLLILIELQILPGKYTEVIGDPVHLNSKGKTNKDESQNQKEESSHSNGFVEQKNPSPPPMQKKAMAPPPAPKPKPARPPTTASYLSISSLTSYISSWTILARVVQKNPVKQWSNARSNGQLFSIVLKDKNGDEIRGTFFNDEVDKFNDIIQIDKVYVISGGRIKTANKKYSNIDHDYEITFDKNTTFEECTDSDQDSIGEMTYNFIKLRDLENIEVNTFVDVLAVVTNVQQSEEIHSNKNNKSYSKRTIILTDDSNTTVECTLWGDDSLNFPMSSVDTVLRIKGAKVGDFHGKNLGTTSNTILKFLDRSDPQAANLYDWYDENKDNVESFDKISSGFGGGDYSAQMIYLDEINTHNLGRGEKPDNFCVYVSLKDIPQNNRNLYYLACPNPDCKNKGVQQEGERYICGHCKKVTDDPVPRFAFNAIFGDFSGSAFFSILGDENGKDILGVNAEEWKNGTDGMEDIDKQKLIKPFLFKDFKLRGRAKVESYNSEERVKMYVSAISEIDYADAAKFYAAEIDKF